MHSPEGIAIVGSIGLVLIVTGTLSAIAPGRPAEIQHESRALQVIAGGILIATGAAFMGAALGALLAPET